ncbi:hypothetical protein [Neobacillus mesonae]|uniref:hypothetical protein n=1 Tax=Neobacillus mesonae TaxID=1193713 RepID=UPI00203F63A7|nr:hypothetical protein [Neobacillus mesonae]MCM3570865.1 hypothetical protein [Neobacillus mesonae]
MWLLIGIGAFLSFGFLVDLWYKRKGIRQTNPVENSKHVSSSERIYIESYMHNMRNDQHGNGGI